MSIQTSKTQEVEVERLHLINEMVAEEGADWLEQYKPGSFGCHELLDRTSVAAENVERSVLSHPACVQNPEWYALAEQAVSALNRLYQSIGAEHPTS